MRPTVSANKGRAPETRVLQDGLRVVHLKLEADREPALLVADAAKDLVAHAKVRAAPGKGFARIGEGQTDGA